MKVEEVINKAKKLPPNPEILPKLLNTLQDDGSSYWDIARLINLDQALTSQVLCWSNSSYYGYLKPSVDVEEAISRVGVNEIYKLVGIEIGKRLLSHSAKFYALSPTELFESSLAAAFSMETLAGRTGVDLNIAYTAGLLHGIGKLVIDQVFENKYADVFKLISEEGYTLTKAEKQILGFNHAEIGQALLSKWNFQLQITESVGFQYMPSLAVNYTELSYMMNIAHFIVAGIGENAGRDAMALEMDGNAMTKLQLTESDLQFLMIEVSEKMEVMKSQLLGAQKTAF